MMKHGWGSAVGCSLPFRKLKKPCCLHDTHTLTHSDPNCCLSPAGWKNKLPEGISLSPTQILPPPPPLLLLLLLLLHSLFFHPRFFTPCCISFLVSSSLVSSFFFCSCFILCLFGFVFPIALFLSFLTTLSSAMGCTKKDARRGGEKSEQGDYNVKSPANSKYRVSLTPIQKPVHTNGRCIREKCSLLWFHHIFFLSAFFLAPILLSCTNQIKHHKLLNYEGMYSGFYKNISWLAFCFVIWRLFQTDSSFEMIIPPTEPQQCAVTHDMSKITEAEQTSLFSHTFVGLLKIFSFILLSSSVSEVFHISMAPLKHILSLIHCLPSYISLLINF